MGTRVSSPIIVGRASELEGLLDALARALAGQASVVLLGGAAGIGKTRLIQEFASRAERQGARVLVGSSIDLGGGALPLGAWADAFRDVSDEAAVRTGTTSHDLIAEAAGSARRQAGASGERARGAQGLLFEAVLATLGDLATIQPLVVVLEDLHWADRSTLDLFAFVATHARRQRLLLIGTYRDIPMDGRDPLALLLLALERRETVTPVTLAALDETDVRAQIDAITAGSIGKELADRIAQRAGGNPLFAEELLATTDHGPLPATIRDALIGRSVELSEGARLVSSILAVAGRRIDDDLLVRVAGLPEADLDAALREVIDLGVLEVEGDAYRFRHALLADAIYHDLLPRQRRRIHGRLAAALAGTPGVQGDPIQRPRSPTTGTLPATIEPHCSRGSRPLDSPATRSPSPRPFDIRSERWSSGISFPAQPSHWASIVPR